MKVRNIAAGLILCMAAAGCARYLAEHAEVSSNVNGRELPISSVETKEPKIALTFDVAWGARIWRRSWIFWTRKR
ncbi:hypothetical protein H6A17_08040 [Mordavella massiliensis]|nr:hypothetical protein [Mordavella massiliensis]